MSLNYFSAQLTTKFTRLRRDANSKLMSVNQSPSALMDHSVYLVPHIKIFGAVVTQNNMYLQRRLVSGVVTKVAPSYFNLVPPISDVNLAKYEDFIETEDHLEDVHANVNPVPCIDHDTMEINTTSFKHVRSKSPPAVPSPKKARGGNQRWTDDLEYRRHILYLKRLCITPSRLWTSRVYHALYIYIYSSSCERLLVYSMTMVPPIISCLLL